MASSVLGSEPEELNIDANLDEFNEFKEPDL